MNNQIQYTPTFKPLLPEQRNVQKALFYKEVSERPRSLVGGENVEKESHDEQRG